MEFREGQIYHIYNQGNNLQEVFLSKKNYIYFLTKTRKYISPYCDILSYCLLPDQFNFLIHANSNSTAKDGRDRYYLSEGLRILLSSYCKGINVQEKRTGSLFRQNSQIKCLDINSYSAIACFIYIHQKPNHYGITNDLSEWDYSSYKDYAGLRNGSLCNIQLTYSLLGIENKHIEYLQNLIIPEDILKSIF